ncbi:MAG: hypothetical protein E6J99_03130 [Methanobacteriota archaeon]|nr:MAG: hypothetical protein E6J99_03130 [Euryarchaeota archaeon]
MHLRSGNRIPTEEARDMKGTAYLVVWWMSQVPYAAVFDNQVAAEAAASVRNALMVTVSGRDARIDAVQDWYRRDDDGQPMSAEWRNILGQLQIALTTKKPPALKAAGA